MKNIILNGVKFLGIHILLIFISIAFTGLLGFLGGMVMFSVIMSIIYIGIMGGVAWDMGHNDNAPFSKTKPSPVNGVYASIIPSIVGIVFVILIAFKINVETVSTAAKMWYIMFIGFFKYDEYARLCELIPMVLSLPIVASIGYFMGMRNIGSIEKMDANIRKRGERRKQKREEDHKRRVELEAKRRNLK